MKRFRKILIISGIIACFIACIGDFAVTFIFGSRYPGYSQLHDTMSALGASASPVTGIISAWWMLMGVLFILFAIAFRLSFRPDSYVKTASLLIVLYGLGEGLGSGIFKADPSGRTFISSYMVHNFVGGIGVIAIMALPLIMKKIIHRDANPLFCHISNLVFAAGILFIMLFLFRFGGTGVVAALKGLWQRLFVLNSYLYLLLLNTMMMRNLFLKNHDKWPDSMIFRE